MTGRESDLRSDLERGRASLHPMWEDPGLINAFVTWHRAAVEFYRPASVALLDAAGVLPGARVLDVGTGTGIPALFAAELVGPDGVVIATDPSAGLLAAAEANAEAAGVKNLQFRQAAVEALPFPESSFDAVVSQLGLMFTANLMRALGEIRRVLRPGSRAAFLAWGPYEQNPFWSIYRDIANRYQEEQVTATTPKRATEEPEDRVADPDPRQPFRFAEPASLDDALRSAGFMDVHVELRDIGLPVQTPEPILQLWLNANHVDETLPEERRQLFYDDVLAAYWSFATGDGLEVPACFVLGSGRA